METMQGMAILHIAKPHFVMLYYHLLHFHLKCLSHHFRRHTNFKKKEAEHLEEANHLSDERSKIGKDAAHILTLITRKWADDLDNLSVNLSSFWDILEDGENFAIPEDDALEANLAENANLKGAIFGFNGAKVIFRPFTLKV
ncbi:telomerase protein component 1 [Corchorus olitorius]|uniref:Telomerase protein component 1 n=1 Tax=Corchorus olitorius TaxID=93759 RepID=A0A1R3IT14_9ROSI|nr:telomerase protein component 1 [Corchorus olitorius]